MIEQNGSALEKAHAARVRPLVERHHLLLVTLLLTNATAMESLPLFLDRLVPQWLAIVLSVTLVLLFGARAPLGARAPRHSPPAWLAGWLPARLKAWPRNDRRAPPHPPHPLRCAGEVIPQAICTGPNRLAISAFLVPLVQACICVTFVISFPLGKLLDCALGDEHGAKLYERGELKARARG